GKFEAAARSVVRLRLAGGGERLRYVALHHVGTCQHAQCRGILRLVLQRTLRITLGALAVVGSERKLTEQHQGVGRVGRRGLLERSTHRGEHGRRVRLLEQQRRQFGHALGGALGGTRLQALAGDTRGGRGGCHGRGGR